MNIKIEFSAGRAEALQFPAKSAAIELEDGRDAVLAWTGCTAVIDQESKKSTVMGICPVVEFRDGTRMKPSWSELATARVLAVTFEENDIVRTDIKLAIVDPQKNIVLPLDMYATEHPSQIPWPELDRGARPMVRYFNSSGLPTNLCCSGHPGTDRKRFWIEFRSDVTDADIARFMDSHTAPNTGFTANGMFCTRYDKEAEYGIVKSLQYTAPDALDAMMDLYDWVADDMSGRPGHGSQPHGYDRAARAAKICVSNMDPGTADELYRAVWFDRVIQDIYTWMEDNDEENLPQDVIELAAEKYVYDGKYDCNRDYWTNIGSAIKLAKGLEG